MSEHSSVLVANPGSSDPEALLSRALAGDEGAFATLFNSQRERLRRLVRLRLDRRLSGRIDSDDVLQDAYLEARKRLVDFARDPQPMPFHLWLLLVTGQKLIDLHRFHLGAQMRDAGLEVSGPAFGGEVDVFDTDGHLLTPNHFAADAPEQGPLDAPWGIALAPSHFGEFSGDLLIGNVEGAGNINAFDPATGAFLGALTHPDGTPVAIAGLWDLAFGGGGETGRPDQLFFTARFTADDPAGNGLFGVIRAASDYGGGQGAGGDGEDAMAARGTIARLAPPPASATGPTTSSPGRERQSSTHVDRSLETDSRPHPCPFLGGESS